MSFTLPRCFIIILILQIRFYNILGVINTELRKTHVMAGMQLPNGHSIYLTQGELGTFFDSKDFNSFIKLFNFYELFIYRCYRTTDEDAVKTSVKFNFGPDFTELQVSFT